MSETAAQAQWSRPAVASLVLGLLSPALQVLSSLRTLTLPDGLAWVFGVLGLQAITGIPALVLGYRGLYEVNASDGRVHGRRCAVAGMVLGLVGCVTAVVWLIFVILMRPHEAS